MHALKHYISVITYRSQAMTKQRTSAQATKEKHATKKTNGSAQNCAGNENAAACKNKDTKGSTENKKDGVTRFPGECLLE